MGIEHGRADVRVSRQLLNRPYVISIFQQVSGEGMARLVEVAAGGGGWLALHARFPQAVGDEVDDARRGLEGSDDAEECSGPGEDSALRWRMGCHCEGRDPSPVIASTRLVRGNPTAVVLKGSGIASVALLPRNDPGI